MSRDPISAASDAAPSTERPGANGADPDQDQPIPVEWIEPALRASVVRLDRIDAGLEILESSVSVLSAQGKAQRAELRELTSNVHSMALHVSSLSDQMGTVRELLAKILTRMPA